MRDDTDLIDEIEALERSLNDLSRTFGDQPKTETMSSRTAGLAVVSAQLTRLAEAA